MKSIVVTSNFVSALFIIIILIGLYVTIRKPSRKTIYYRYCLWICLFGLLANGLSTFVDGRFENNFICLSLSYLSCIAIDFLIGFYAFYLYLFIREKKENFTVKFSIYIMVLCAIDLIMLTIGTITGHLFEVHNGIFYKGVWWDFLPLIPALCLVSIFVLLSINIKKIGVGTVLGLGSYLMVAFICALIQLVFDELETGYIGAALALVIIYVSIQSRVIAETRLRAEIYNDLSTKDVLTGLKNRRGYEEALSTINENDHVGVIFCDLNALKFVNDKFGHDNGDKLIKRFSNMMSDAFPNDILCRISGDEFVTIVKDVNPTDFSDKINNLEELITNNDRIASLGFAIGDGKEVLEVIKDAEKMMYVDKDKYYIETKKERRI